MKKKLSKSLRKHISSEKARIRREVLSLKKQEELISKLYLPKKSAVKSKIKKKADSKPKASPSNKVRSDKTRSKSLKNKNKKE